MKTAVRILLTFATVLALGSPILAAEAGASGRPDIKWGTKVDWQTWEEGTQLAAKEGKPICLVVYADWCPKCRTLAPLFQTESMVALSKEVVMILQDADEKPAWLKEKFGATGSYVPRVLFLNPDGSLRTDLTSGNGKYPYFYWPGNENLEANLEKVASKND